MKYKNLSYRKFSIDLYKLNAMPGALQIFYVYKPSTLSLAVLSLFLMCTVTSPASTVSTVWMTSFTLLPSTTDSNLGESRSTFSPPMNHSMWSGLAGTVRVHSNSTVDFCLAVWSLRGTKKSASISENRIRNKILKFDYFISNYNNVILKQLEYMNMKQLSISTLF